MLAATRNTFPLTEMEGIIPLAEVLSDDNRALLRVIREQKSESLSRLAEITGRAPSNLSRTLKAMEHYGLVEMRRDVRTVRPVVKASEFVIQAA